ncbi:hypothetical protein NH340_JMT01253 [Sarcoptes scabiei]|nr:hypothetical protein NH340_JMT01253 [Sarcoptes scabiei]
MISLIKVYLIQFYLVMVGFSFIMMMQHYSIIYMTRFATDKPIYIAIQLSMISKIFAIIYYTAFYGRINDEAINLAKLIYQYLNIDDVYFRNKSILFQKHNLQNIFNCLDHSFGLCFMRNSINLTNVIQLISLFFSLSTMVIWALNS